MLELYGNSIYDEENKERFQIIEFFAAGGSVSAIIIRQDHTVGVMDINNIKNVTRSRVGFNIE